jgi:2,3-bisphosphoglycerate-dependent phosphoglycerate mutase
MKTVSKLNDLNLLILIIPALLVFSCEAPKISMDSNPCSNSTTIVLIRHAEKIDESENPDLSPAGYKRTLDLKDMMADWNLSHFYSTDYIRTIKTIEPLVALENIPIELYSPDTLLEFATRLKQTANARMIVSGHSNTTPKLVNYLIDKEEFMPLSDDEYGKIFIVTLCEGRAIDWFELNF